MTTDVELWLWRVSYMLIKNELSWHQHGASGQQNLLSTVYVRIYPTFTYLSIFTPLKKLRLGPSSRRMDREDVKAYTVEY